jgi:hypothetical protein
MSAGATLPFRAEHVGMLRLAVEFAKGICG